MPQQGSALRMSFDGVHIVFAGRVLHSTEGAAITRETLPVADRRSDRDSMIVATAMAHDFAIMTNKVRDFEGTAAQLLIPRVW